MNARRAIAAALRIAGLAGGAAPAATVDGDIDIPALVSDIADPRLFGAARDRAELAHAVAARGDAQRFPPSRLPGGATVEVEDRSGDEMLLLVRSEDAATLVSYRRDDHGGSEAWAWSVSSRDMGWRYHLDAPDGWIPAVAHHPAAVQARWLTGRPGHRRVVATWISDDGTAGGPEFRYALLADEASFVPRRDDVFGEFGLNDASFDPAAGPVQVAAGGLCFAGRPTSLPLLTVATDRIEIVVPGAFLTLDGQTIPAPLTLSIDDRGVATPHPERHPLRLIASILGEASRQHAHDRAAPVEGFVDDCAPRTKHFAVEVYPPLAGGEARVEVARNGALWHRVSPSPALRPIRSCPANARWNYPTVGPSG